MICIGIDKLLGPCLINHSQQIWRTWISQDSDDYPRGDHNPTPYLQILFMSLEKAICSIEDEVGSGEGMGDVGDGGIGGAPKGKGEREGNRTGTKREEGIKSVNWRA